MEIMILVESSDPLTGRVVATNGDLPDAPKTEIGFMGWLSLLRTLNDLICPSSAPPGSRE